MLQYDKMFHFVNVIGKSLNILYVINQAKQTSQAKLYFYLSSYEITDHHYHDLKIFSKSLFSFLPRPRNLTVFNLICKMF